MLPVISRAPAVIVTGPLPRLLSLAMARLPPEMDVPPE